LEYNTYTAQNVWCPPSVFVVEKYIEIDNNYAPWAAVAGDTRGRVIAQGYESSPSQAQRDYMYGGLNAVNPIVNFNSKGLEIYGQKTAYRANSALNRVNVKRLMVYIKKLIRLAMMGFVFEANTTATLSKMTNFINSILEPVRQRNGLSSYKVTFTADATNPNLVNGVVKVVPVGTIEFININISVLPTGTTIS
jgi:phage tail sheath protein FI